MHELMLRLQHDCPYNDMSKANPEVTIMQWCNGKTEVFEVTSRRMDSLHGVLRELENLTNSVGAKVIHTSFDKNDAKMLIQVSKGSCSCSRAFRNRKSTSITSQIERSHCLEVWPTVYAEGWEFHRVYALRSEDLKLLFGRLSKISKFEIIYKKTGQEQMLRDAFVVSLKSLFSGITAKQLTAITEALDNGYYTMPRRTTVEDIARLKGVPRTTYEEHVRKAENKILNAVAPFIKLYAGK